MLTVTNRLKIRKIMKEEPGVILYHPISIIMTSWRSTMNKLEVIGQIADLKEVNYKNTLAVATLIELLICKGVFSRHEFTNKARELEQATTAEILINHRRGLEPIQRQFK